MALNITVFDVPGNVNGATAFAPGPPVRSLIVADDVLTKLKGPCLICLIADEDQRLSIELGVDPGNPVAGAVKLKAGIERWMTLSRAGTWWMRSGTGSGADLAISGSPAGAQQAASYSFVPTVTGGAGTRQFALDGTLPAGLAFNTATGAIGGVVREAGSYALAITVLDGSGSQTLPFVLTVAAAALGTLTFSGALKAGVSTSGLIAGATAGSSIAGGVPGIDVDSVNRTYAGTPQVDGDYAGALIETLPGAVGSPKKSAASVAAGGNAGGLPVPAQLRWTPPNVSYTLANGAYARSGPSVASLAPAVTTTLHVDPTNSTGAASDSNAGTSASSPLLTRTAALAKVNANGFQIRIFGLTADYTEFVTAAPTAINFSFQMINDTAFRYRCVRAASATAPTWAATSGQANVYETTIAAADALGLVDLAVTDDIASRIVTPVNGTTADRDRFRAIVNANPCKAQNSPPLLASIAAVAASSIGGRFHDGTKLYVKAANARSLVGDTAMRPLVGGVFFRTGTADGVTQYLKGLEFFGGHTTIFATTANATSVPRIIIDGGSVQHSVSGGTGCGIAVQGPVMLTTYRLLAYKAYSDGLSYHSLTGTGGTDPSPKVEEIEPIICGAGSTGSANASDNASTAHEITDLVRFRPIAIDSDDRVWADINGARSWNVDGYVGAPTNTANTGNLAANLNTLDSAVVINEGVKFAPNSIGVNEWADGTSQIINSNVGTVSGTMAGSGTITPTPPVSADPLAVFKAARNANKNSGGPGFPIAFVGSSITKAFGADNGDGTENTDGFNRGSVTKVAQALTAAGYAVTQDSVWGTGNRSQDYFAYNDRMVGGGTGTGWVVGSATVGGPYWRNSTNANAMTFTPRLQVDTIDLYTPRDTSLGVLSYSIDGGAAVNINLAGTAAFTKTTISLPKGAHSITLARVSGVAAWIGIDAYDSTARQIRVWNMGWGSTTTPAYAGSALPYSPSSALAALAPRYTNIELGINDLDSTSLADYQTALQTVITAAKAGGGSFNFEATHNIQGSVAAANCRSFNDAGIALAQANGGAFIDQQVRFVDWPTASANGYMADGVHMNQTGYTFRAIPTSAQLLAA